MKIPESFFQKMNTPCCASCFFGAVKKYTISKQKSVPLKTFTQLLLRYSYFTVFFWDFSSCSVAGYCHLLVHTVYLEYFWPWQNRTFSACSQDFLCLPTPVRSVVLFELADKSKRKIDKSKRKIDQGKTYGWLYFLHLKSLEASSAISESQITIPNLNTS